MECRCQEAQMPLGRLKAILAEAVWDYLDDLRHGDAAEQEKRLRRVCSGLEHLLNSRLACCEEWNPSWWCDGVLPWTTSVLSPAGLEIHGRAVWALDSRSGGWIEPFAASIQLTAAGDALASYRLQFGNAAYGLGRVAYGAHVRRADWYHPAEWLFVFSHEQDSP
jgi:hypothetical protein